MRPSLLSARVVSARVAAAALAAGLLTVPLLRSAPPVAAADGDAFAAPAQREPDGFAAPSQRTPSPAEASETPAADQDADGPAADAQDADAQDAALPRPAGLGEKTYARVPEETTQLVVVSGEDETSTDSQLSLWEREDDGWVRTMGWDTINGQNGWREDRREGDKTTPEGVFSLSDAGGFLDDPGSDLPYYQDAGLRGGAEAVYGEGYENVFDYVIAIDYNRKTGVAPTENTRPEGWDKGGKIWLHVEHTSPTSGCVSMPADDLKRLIRELKQDSRPHIAMGEAEFLAQ